MNFLIALFVLFASTKGQATGDEAQSSSTGRAPIPAHVVQDPPVAVPIPHQPQRAPQARIIPTAISIAHTRPRWEIAYEKFLLALHEELTHRRDLGIGGEPEFVDIGWDNGPDQTQGYGDVTLNPDGSAVGRFALVL